MGDRPEGCTLDRIDNDQGYFPVQLSLGNLATEQAANRRSRRPFTDSVLQIMKVWQSCDRVESCYHTLTWQECTRRSFATQAEAQEYLDECIYERYFHWSLGL